jgi:cytochrome c553
MAESAGMIAHRHGLGRVVIAMAAALGGHACAAAEDGVHDAARGALIVPADPAFRAPPLTVECRVRLNSWGGYNILVANEPKSSATHWEIFTTPKDGRLHVYLPGRTPNHLRTPVALATGRWYAVAMVLEADRARLYVDGAEAGAVATASRGGATTPGPMAIGGLSEGGTGCDGSLDDVRILRGAWPPGAALAPPDSVLADWRFGPTAPLADSSMARRVATLRAHVVHSPAGEGMAGGMSAAFQPLPPAEDAAPLRAALAETARRLGLKTVRADDARDGVVRAWSREFDGWNQRDHPAQRGGGPDRAKLEREVVDRHSLVWDSDGGPTGTTLRRASALLDHLAAAHGETRWAAARADLDLLRAAPGAAGDRGLHLAACAVRRQIVMANPLLDFDALLCAARGTFAGSVRSNPTTADIQGGHFVTQYFGFNALPGGGLYVVRNLKGRPAVVDVLADAAVQNGRLRGRRLESGAVATPDLAPDGRSIVFAWTANREHRWAYDTNTCFHLFRVNADGSDLRQLTDGAWNDFDPCWLPDGRVAFVSERRGGYIRCFAASLKVRNYTMMSVASDGSDLRALSYFETAEWNPTVDNDGRLAFTRWDYVDRENCLGTRHWVCNPDGTNPRAPHGNYPHPYHTFPDHEPWAVEGGREIDSRRGAPLVEMGIRAVPGSPLFAFTAAPHHGEVFGSLCLLDLRVPDDRHMSQVRRFTPDEPFPESEIPGRRHYKYGMPWPLDEDFILCNRWEDVVLVDRFGNQELLVALRELPGPQDERLRLVDPVPLRPRARPPVIPAAVRCAERPDAPPATIAVMNVADSDLPFPPGVKPRWLRVVQAIPKTNHAMGEPMIGYERENTPRIPLGVVPVEADGSAHFQAPVAKQLIFQVLDERFMAIQSMRSVAFVHPGEQLSCLGCHEDPHRASPPAAPPLAMRRAPSRLEPECGPVEPVSYHRQVRPILARTCVPCHAKEGKGPADMSYEALKEGWTFWFSGAMAWNMTTAYSGIHGGSRTIPGRFGARASRIGQALLTPRHLAAVSGAERHQVILWLDCNSNRLGAYENEAAQLRGELVWPSLDVDPANVAGVEFGAPPLRGLFWHEQAVSTRAAP